MSKKIIALLLAVTLFINSASPLFVVSSFAQEATPAPEQQQSVEPTPVPLDPTPAPSASTEATPQPSTEPVSSATPIPTPTPTPTMSPKEYDVWKAEKNRLDDEREAREDEWEAHEEDKSWVAAHGGNEEYYVSGQWEADKKAEEEAAAAAAAAALQNQQLDSLTPPPSSDPFASVSTPGSSGCDNTTSTDPFTEQSAFSGADQNNSAVSENSDTVSVENNNCTDISNSSSTSGTSGNNSVINNDGSVGLTTGSSSGNGQLQNNANTNATDTQGFGSASSNANESFAQDSSAENLSTEENTTNFSQSNDSYTLTVDNNNAAVVDNQMDVTGTSGENTVTNNDGDATLSTGDIELIANMLNILNLNVTGEDFLHLIVNIFGQLNGTVDLDDIALALGYGDDDELEVIARNSNTGEDSENTADANSETNTDINNANNAEVNNDLNVSAVSGRNDVSGNDGGADVITGRIKVLANVLNFINTNLTGEKWKFIMINIFGSLNGDIVVPGTDQYLADGSGQGGAQAQNTNPGEGSTNNQSASSLDETSVANTNNVDLVNNVNVNGVSGNNDQSGNDDGSGEHTTQTGGTDVASRVLNYLNFNITGNNWVFLIVNVFGKWMGQIVGFADNGTMDAPTQGSFAALSVGSGGGQTSATNSDTGEGSINNANASSTNNSSVNNDNYAKVTNNINVEGISGENAVNNNDAGTSLTTGWVEIDANLLNIINTNITGRSWMVVFVNVFGDFMGNLFFGNTAMQDYNAAAAAAQENNPDTTEVARGGSSEQPSPSNSDNNNNTTQNSQTNNSASSDLDTTTNSNVRVRGAQVLAVTSTPMEEENPESYQAVYNDAPQGEENSTEESTQPGLLGFIAIRLGIIRNFLYNLYISIKSAIEPVFAQLHEINLLS